MRRTTAILTPLAGLTLCGCDPANISLAGKWEYHESARVKSPDSVVDAILLTEDAGATTATTYFLYIVPTGKSFSPKGAKDSHALFDAIHVKNLKVVWRTSRLLEIQYDEALIDHFQNMWHDEAVQDYHYIVELRLAPTTSEFALPSMDRVFPGWEGRPTPKRSRSHDFDVHRPALDAGRTFRHISNVSGPARVSAGRWADRERGST
jgi:hypothetical protein